MENPKRDMKLVTLLTFDTAIYADMFRNRLEAEGIRACTADAHTVTLDWFRAQAYGGVKVQVLENDVERAMAILKEMDKIPGHHVFIRKKKCPECGSEELKYSRWPLLFFFFLLWLLGFPAYFRSNISCEECGHKWKERPV